MLSWNDDTLSLVALTFTAALWVLLHLALALRVARSGALPVWLRAVGWLPPLTPVAAFLCGAKLRALAWCVVSVTYLVIRTRV